MAINYNQLRNQQNNQGNNKPAEKKSSIILRIIFCGLFAALLVGFGIFNLINHADYYFGSAKNIDDMLAAGNVEKDEYVSIGVDAVFDWYAETTHKVNGIPTGKEQHCIVWLSNGDIISMTVKGKKNYEKIDEIIDATWAAWDDETGTTGLHTPVVFEGKVTSVGYEVKQYYDDYIRDMEDAGFFEWYGTRYYELTIDTTDNKMSTLMWYIGGLLIVVLMVWGVVSGVKDIKKSKTANNAGYDANVYNSMNGSNMSGYNNVPQNDYVNDIVNNDNNYNNNGGFGV
ncbi:MAG: hypothetical protein IJ053_06005 [Lachnospiraceae bacterium]|nr:hypothetical protein [Lachnospiraceae bacterium]